MFLRDLWVLFFVVVGTFVVVGVGFVVALRGVTYGTVGFSFLGGSVEALQAVGEAVGVGKPRFRGWIHTWAVGVAAVGVAVLVVFGFRESATAGWSTLVYGVGVCALFGISAVYHRVTWGSVRARVRMKRADHSMIFLFIAGSYTPFALLGLPAESGRTLLVVVWVGALAGVALKLLWPTAPRWVGVPLYLLLGWAIVPVAGTMLGNVGVWPMVLLAVGGVIYSVGAVLYATKWPNPWDDFGHHEFFHAATVLAALCHYVAIWLVLLG